MKNWRSLLFVEYCKETVFDVARLASFQPRTKLNDPKADLKKNELNQKAPGPLKILQRRPNAVNFFHANVVFGASFVF